MNNYCIKNNLNFLNCPYKLDVLLGTSMGLMSYDYLSNYMLVGIPGVNYYAEAHLTLWNSYVHTVFMPFTTYGMLLWIPALFNLNHKNGVRLMWILYNIYGGHYLKVNIQGALMYYFIYYNVVRYASKFYVETHLHYQNDEHNTETECNSFYDNYTAIVNNNNNNNHNNTPNTNQCCLLGRVYINLRNICKSSPNIYLFGKGFFIATTALAIQEVFGHHLGGDIPSRVEAIPNAILYAIYFSTGHILH